MPLWLIWGLLVLFCAATWFGVVSMAMALAD